MAGVTIDSIAQFLESLAPRRLAESWDNVGLLVGDRARIARRVMTCLTVTPDSASEAIERQCDLIVTHHPLPFKPLPRVTTDDTPGRLVWQLCQASISIFSAHTAYDSATRGINQLLAEGLGLSDIRPLVASPDDPTIGSGRLGKCSPATTLGTLAQQVRRFLRVPGLLQVGSPELPVRSIAIGCGSAGVFVGPARRAGCDALLLGEANFHTCLEAEALGLGLLLPGHYASERLGVERLADDLRLAFPQLEVWASERERDPLVWNSTDTRE